MFPAQPRGEPTARRCPARPGPQPCLPRLWLPGFTCLQESSAGGAQEHHGVVVDTGHGHGCEAAVGEHGGRCDGVDDGQRVLQVSCSTVQLLRLQLPGDTRVSGCSRHQGVPITTTAPGFLCTELTALLCPGKAPHHQAMGTGRCNWLIQEQEL